MHQLSPEPKHASASIDRKYKNGGDQFNERKKSLPHSIIFERVRPQELRHTKVNDKLAQGFRDKFYQKTKEHTLKIIDGENHTFAEFPKQADNIRLMND